MKQKKPQPTSKCIQKIATREILTTIIADEIKDRGEATSKKLIAQHKKLRFLNTGSINIKRRKRINKAMKVINEGMKEKK